MAAYERDKVKGAIRTDFILSAEIIVIALGTVAGAPLQQQLAVLAAVAVAMTVGVYGFVAGIVKMDDAGLWLARRGGAASQAVGRFLLAAAPRLMQALSVLGTAAMFLVGGGILVHGIGPLHHVIAEVAGGQGKLAGVLLENGANVVVGLAAGALVLAGVAGVRRLRGR
jgi:predicted DNA repair protein MutK